VPNIHPFLQPAPPPRPTVESRRADRMAALRIATAEVARCERVVDGLIGRLAEKSIGRVGLSPVTEHTLRNAVSQLSLGQVQVARLREVLLEREEDDAETCEGLGEALRGAFDRIVCGTGRDDNDEHRLGYVDLLGGRF